jgi:hypothetical protein
MHRLPSWRAGLLAALLFACLGGVLAQQPTAPGAPDPDALGTEPRQSVTATGRVQQFTHSATGAVDGFVLDTGTVVHFPGYLSRQVTGLVSQNARVRVTGIMVSGTDPGAARLLEARTITELDRKVTLTVTGSGVNQPGSTVSGDGDGAADGAAGAGGAGTGAAGGAGGAR